MNKAGPASSHHSQFNKRRQFFISTHNEALTVAMRVSNEDRSSAGIHSCGAAPTPTGSAEIVSDDFPVFHLEALRLGLVHDFTGRRCCFIFLLLGFLSALARVRCSGA